MEMMKTSLNDKVFCREKLGKSELECCNEPLPIATLDTIHNALNLKTSRPQLSDVPRAEQILQY